MSYIESFASLRTRFSSIRNLLSNLSEGSPRGSPILPPGMSGRDIDPSREDELAVMSRRLELALEASGVGVWEYHPATGTLIWDARMREIFGMPEDGGDLGYEDFRARVDPADVAAVERALADSLTSRRTLVGQFRISTPHGETKVLRAYGVTHTRSNGHRMIIGANWDVTKDIMIQGELRAAEERALQQNTELKIARLDLEHQALHDALTGLPNRRYVERFLSDLKSATEIVTTPVACLHIDLDRFKEVNDTAGHLVGDEAIRIVAEKLRALGGAADFLARIGGDEFVIFLQGPEAAELATTLGDRIVKAIAAPITIQGLEWRLGASVGIAVQKTACNISQLITDADIALYEAKKQGRGRLRIYSPSLKSDIVTNRQLADQILHAIDADEFEPFFQPQFDAHTLEIVGAEALARWKHPERGLISPAAFLPVAEQIGKLCAIDEIILTKSMRAFHGWRTKGVSVPRISVNVSAQRLRDETFIEKVSALTFEAGTLSFELLESISFDEQDQALASSIAAIRELGIEIEIDDFGTGHASLVSLVELAPHRLKIDRKLVRPLASSGSQHKLISAIIDIANSLGIDVIAEGVETREQIDILRSLGCAALQGFLLARPMPESELISFALSRKWFPGNA